MPREILPDSFLQVLSHFRSAFTSPSYSNFTVLMAGFVHALGGHRVTDALRAAGPAASKHFVSYYRFLSHGAWSLDGLGRILIAMLTTMLGTNEVELVLDDTLTHRKGKNVALAGMHADAALKKESGGRLFTSFGHVFVVLSVFVSVPTLGRTGWALPVLFRLFEGSGRGGQGDAPSDSRRAWNRRQSGKVKRKRVRMTDREVVDGAVADCAEKPDDGPLPTELRPKKTELAAELILLVASWFPMLQFRVLADHLYNGRSVLHTVLSSVDNVHIISRGRADAALYDLPVIPENPGRGRPRVKGKRLLNPTLWAEANRDQFRTVKVDLYGHDVTVQIASYCGMSYRSLPGRLLRYVIVKDPAGIYKTDYFLCTDLELSDEKIVEAYGRRWQLERTFQDCKQRLQVENTQVQLPKSVRRSVPLGMLLYSLIVFWYVTKGHKEADEELQALAPDPWYSTSGSRPSFREMQSKLRRLGWARGLLDPPQDDTEGAKMMADYLIRVVASA